MKLPENIRRTEVIAGGLVLLSIACISIVLITYSNGKSDVNEPEAVVESIRQAVLARQKAFPADGVISTDWAPREVGALTADATEWTSNSGFTKLGWSPADLGLTWVRGAYKVRRTKEGFQVLGRIDADGDGTPVEWEASHETAATRVSEPSIR